MRIFCDQPGCRICHSSRWQSCHRRQELDLADRITAELCGGFRPTEKEKGNGDDR